MALTKRSALSAIVYDRYGSKKGLLRHVFYKTLWLCGAFRHDKSIDASQYKRLVFVCSGNICRSPLAEAYARHLGVNAVSCGLHCTEDHQADPRAQAYAKTIGLDLTVHKTRHIRNFEFQSSDLIIGMEPSHLIAIKEYQIRNATLGLAGVFCDPARPYIHDPYNCSDDFFFQCEAHVVNAVEKLLAQ